MKSVVLRYDDKEFDVRFDPAKVTPAKMLEKIKAEGFTPSVKREGEAPPK